MFTIDLATRLPMVSITSQVSTPSPVTTAVASAPEKLPENTLKRAKTRCSVWVRSEYDHSTVGPEGLVALDRTTATAGEQPEALVEQGDDLVGVHR